MQVKLITIIETVIEIDPENDPTFEEAKREIFGSLQEAIERDGNQDQYVEAVQCLHTGAVVYDKVLTATVTHSFEEVK